MIYFIFFTSIGIFLKQNSLQPTEIHFEPKLTYHSAMLAARLDNVLEYIRMDALLQIRARKQWKQVENEE